MLEDSRVVNERVAWALTAATRSGVFLFWPSALQISAWAVIRCAPGTLPPIVSSPLSLSPPRLHWVAPPSCCRTSFAVWSVQLLNLFAVLVLFLKFYKMPPKPCLNWKVEQFSVNMSLDLLGFLCHDCRAVLLQFFFFCYSFQDMSENSGQQLLVKARFNFLQTNEDELTFNKGDIIGVTRQEDGGWWEGTLNGKTGWFPSNYVREVKGSGGCHYCFVFLQTLRCFVGRLELNFLITHADGVSLYLFLFP